MTYKTISSLYSRNKKIPSSLNDPYNMYSYGNTSIENFIPIVNPGSAVNKVNTQESQAAIQQQIIYLHKTQEMEKEKAQQLQNIRRMQLFKYIQAENQDENNTENLVLNLENKLNILNKLVNEDANNI